MQSTEIRLVRLVLASIWLTTSALSLGLYPVEQSLTLLNRTGLQGQSAISALVLGAATDAFMGLATLFRPSRALWLAQGMLVVAYTSIITYALPEFWLHPFGPILKNLAVLTLIWLLFKHQQEAT